MGLLCVLWALVSKLNEVARSLDPVRNGIGRLGTQLEESRASLAAQEEQRRRDALKLATVTAELRDSLARLQHMVASVAAAQDEAARAASGVVIGGGIGPKIRAKSADGPFTAAFPDKGRLSGLMASTPVPLALQPNASRLGAARVATLL